MHVSSRCFNPYFKMFPLILPPFFKEYLNMKLPQLKDDPRPSSLKNEAPSVQQTRAGYAVRRVSEVFLLFRILKKLIFFMLSYSGLQRRCASITTWREHINIWITFQDKRKYTNWQYKMAIHFQKTQVFNVKKTFCLVSFSSKFCCCCPESKINFLIFNPFTTEVVII